MIDTTGTYRVAYVLVAVIYVAYALSLRWRARKYQGQADEHGERGGR